MTCLFYLTMEPEYFFERPAYLGPTDKWILRWSTKECFIIKKSARLKEPVETPLKDFRDNMPLWGFWIIWNHKLGVLASSEPNFFRKLGGILPNVSCGLRISFFLNHFWWTELMETSESNSLSLSFRRTDEISASVVSEPVQFCAWTLDHQKKYWI